MGVHPVKRFLGDTRAVVLRPAPPTPSAVLVSDLLHRLRRVYVYLGYPGTLVSPPGSGLTNCEAVVVVGCGLVCNLHDVQLGICVVAGGRRSVCHLNRAALVALHNWPFCGIMSDGGEIWVDDELLYKDGDFVIEF